MSYAASMEDLHQAMKIFNTFLGELEHNLTSRENSAFGTPPKRRKVEEN
jgi:hypothetical protein